YMLQNLGYNTTSVNNGNQCLEILTKQHFDLILMDMQMPILDGYETTKIIRNDKNLAHIPIIALTAFAMEGDAERCISSGCDYYLSKPVSQLELYEALNKILYNSKANNNNPSPNLIDDLIPEFITTTQELIDKLHIAIENQNLELAMDITHDLKGMCGMYGFPDLSEAAAAIHEYARHQDTSNLIKAYQSLKDKFFEQFKKHSLQ
ncbi:MAG: response regulator, partial [Syntrophomonadaceae bacterium]|nr:response regulator [Syntrophomonadaceae bacterium]